MKFGGKKYCVQFNSMNFNLIYEFESNPIPFQLNLRISIQFKL
jgi:hypothetical protein